jgi:hypothetical protein
MEDEVITPLITGVKNDLVYAVLLDQGQLYTYLTRIVTVRSSKGGWYTMVLPACATTL